MVHHLSLLTIHSLPAPRTPAFSSYLIVIVIGKWKSTTEVMITFFNLWDPVSIQYEVMDVIDGHSLVYGRWRLLDIDYPPDAKA